MDFWGGDTDIGIREFKVLITKTVYQPSEFLYNFLNYYKMNKIINNNK